MLKKNYHTHTVRCHHAQGTMDEYIQTGISRGLEVLGFSDHAPYPYKNKEFSSNCRMSLAETKDYVADIQKARETYEGKIKLLIGYEVEYYPDCFEDFLKHVTQYPVDYLILGQHFLNNEYDGQSVGMPVIFEAPLKKYVDQVISGMESGVISYVAHPDVINFIGSEKIYEKQMKRLIDRAAVLGIPLEYNLLGFREKRRYPKDFFWQMVGAEGSRITTVLGCDAHRPVDVADPKVIEEATRKLATYGIVPSQEIELRPVKVK